MCKQRFRRASWPAFTLVEALIVISIIGLLIGLIIPAVMSARESARRLECSNRLKQLGIALNAHAAAHSTFPSPMPARLVINNRRFADPQLFSGFYELLPYCEKSSLYNAINLGSSSGLAGPTLGPFSRQNRTVAEVEIGLFICPSETSGRSTRGSHATYRFNVGTRDAILIRSTPEAGAFDPIQFLKPAEYLDGLSSTIGMSERVLGSMRTGVFDRKRDMWCANVNSISSFDSADEVFEMCHSLTAAPPYFVNDLGSTWMSGGNINVWYNHVAPPNDRGADCVTGDANSQDPEYCHSCSLAARSWHRGGVNALTMDGSVHFIRDGISLGVWRALATRAGAETIMDDW